MSDSSPTPGPEQPPKIGTGVAHTARVWNYWLGGKDNFAADREVGEQIRAVIPDIVVFARAEQAFLGRAVRYLADEVGIRQCRPVRCRVSQMHISRLLARALAQLHHLLLAEPCQPSNQARLGRGPAPPPPGPVTAGAPGHL